MKGATTMKQGAVGLFNSKRGVFCMLLTAASIVFVIVGVMPIDQWTDYTKWIATTLVFAHTVTGVATTIKGAPTPSTSGSQPLPEVRTTSSSGPTSTPT